MRYGVAVTVDGKRAVSASGNNTLKVWDLESGRALRTLESHSDFCHWRSGVRLKNSIASSRLDSASLRVKRFTTIEPRESAGAL